MNITTTLKESELGGTKVIGVTLIGRVDGDRSL